MESILGIKFTEHECDYLGFKARFSLGKRIDIKLSPSLHGRADVGTAHHIAC